MDLSACSEPGSSFDGRAPSTELSDMDRVAPYLMVRLRKQFRASNGERPLSNTIVRIIVYWFDSGVQARSRTCAREQVAKISQ